MRKAAETKIHKPMKKNDSVIKSRCKNSTAATGRIDGITTLHITERQNHPPIKRPTPCLGFRYTDSQEARIKRAMEDAVEYMKGYGKGRQPRMIDTSHYDITGLTDDTD